MSEELTDTGCASCGAAVDYVTKGTPLCHPCRQQFIAFSIPIWIKIFSGLLLCILLFSLYTLPKNIQTGIHSKRGLKAAEANNFMTAETEFAKASGEEPDYVDAKCRLLIASFYNNHFGVFYKTSQALENQKIEDQDLFSAMQSLVDRSNLYFPKDSFYQIMQRYHSETDSIPEAVYKTYLASFPDDGFAMLRLANIYLDQKRYVEADTLANSLLIKQPDYYGAMFFKASLKRDQMQLDSSNYFLDRLLAINHQDVYAISSKARNLLKEKQDAAALTMVKKAVVLDPADAYSLGTLALVYHFTNDIKNRDAVVQQLSKDTLAGGMLVYVKDIISGKENFRK